MDSIKRRDFVRNMSVAAVAAAALPRYSFGAVKGSDRIKVGLIGCGWRGRDATCNMIEADNNIKIVAVADLYEEPTKGAVAHISNFAKSKCPKTANEIADASKIKRFWGWEAVDNILAEDIDVVINAAPPAFRAPHYKKIVAAGKHAFLEKPAAIDITQARSMLELADVARQKKLCVVCGTQRRYHEGYQEIIKRVHDGMIGRPVAAYAYWNEGMYVGDPQYKKVNVAPDTMEYQTKNWYSFIWASGDHIVEQHVHNLDVIMWALGDNRQPLDVRGYGGRSTDLPMPKYGDRFSHFSIDFNFGGGLRLQSYCHQDPKTSRKIEEVLVGTKGIMRTGLYPDTNNVITDLDGKVLYKAPSPQKQCLVEEHRVLLNAIRTGQYVNVLETMVNSNLLAITGRMSAYAGKEFKYEWALKRAKEDLMPKEMKFGQLPVGSVPVPGKYRLA